MWNVAIKKPLADLCQAIGAWNSPYRLCSNDQACPKILGTLYKGRAAVLVMTLPMQANVDVSFYRRKEPSSPP
jgi:hypothetical protein